jgi:hypothetical protein
VQKLNLGLNLVVYSDSTSTSNPVLKDLDYNRQMMGISTDGLYTKRYSNVGPGTSVTVASNARTITQDATTQWTVSLVTGNIYRYKWVAGTNPGLRTDRGLGGDATTQWTVMVNGPVVRYTASAGTAPVFTSIQPGDSFLVEDLGPFNVANTGIFLVLGKGSNYVEISNGSGAAEGPILQGTRADGLPAVSAYSNGPVVVEDEVRIKATTPFNSANQGSFTVIRVTQNYFDVENAIPGYPQGPIVIGDATGIVFYSSLYRWIFVESDQKVSVRLNGDTSDNYEVDPITPGDPNQVGVLLLRGTVYQLVVANNGVVAANVKVALSE